VIRRGQRLGSPREVALTERDLVVATRGTAKKLREPELATFDSDAQYSAAGVWMFSRRGLQRLGWSNKELDEAGGSIAR
jgi:hypothetical protein